MEERMHPGAIASSGDALIATITNLDEHQLLKSKCQMKDSILHAARASLGKPFGHRRFAQKYTCPAKAQTVWFGLSIRNNMFFMIAPAMAAGPKVGLSPFRAAGKADRR
jgi:hypothetical protein